MRIIKGAESSRVEWTARKLMEMYNDGKVDFNIDIQRGYVWKDNDKRSALIRSMILDRHIPPLYFNKVEDTFEGQDGKQRTITIHMFLKDEFALSGLDIFSVTNDDGEIEEMDINGMKYSELPECFQNAIKEYSFMICFTDNAEQDEVAETFYNLNNGQGLNAATMNRVKAKSKDAIFRLGKHKLFQDALSESALEGHANDDLVAKAHAILHTEEPVMDTKWIRPYMRNMEITESEESQLNEIFDRIYNMHGMVEDKKIANRIYVKTHMISIIPIILQSIHDGHSDKEMAEWFVSFFCGKKSATVSSNYNSAATSGSGKKNSVKIRLDEVKASYNQYFNK